MLKEFLEVVADTKYNMNGTKIKQNERNALKNELIETIIKDLKKAFEGSDLITIYRTQKGVGIAIDNEKIGIIPIELVPTIKDLDNDLADMEEEYNERKIEVEENKKKRQAEKERKFKQEQELREQRAKAKAEKEALQK